MMLESSDAYGSEILSSLGVDTDTGVGPSCDLDGSHPEDKATTWKRAESREVEPDSQLLLKSLALDFSLCEPVHSFKTSYMLVIC